MPSAWAWNAGMEGQGQLGKGRAGPGNLRCGVLAFLPKGTCAELPLPGCVFPAAALFV